MHDPIGSPGGGTRSPPTQAHAWSRRVRGYVRLLHPLAIFLVESATAGFAVIAWGGLPPASLLARMLLAMLGGQVAIGAVNELLDEPDDAIGKPHKPLPSGIVSRRGAWAVTASGLLAMTIIGASLGRAPLVLLLLGTGLGLAYNIWFKRTAWSWLPYLLALPLLPIWVFVSLDQFVPSLLLFYPLGALASIGVHFAQSLPDTVVDRAAGFTNPTSRLGMAPSFALAWLAALSAPLLAWIVAWSMEEPASVGFAALTALALLLLVINLALIATDVSLGVAVCFPLIGVVTLTSGIFWAIAVAG